MEVNFWKGFFNSVNCEFQLVSEIQGASGIKHNILCIGVDEEKRRLVVVQDEQDARILSMVQADIQAKIRGYNVLMVRPVPINLATAFSAVGLLFGSSKVTQADFKNLSENKENVELIVQENKGKIENLFNAFSPQIEVIQKTKLSIVPIIKEVVQQLSHVKFNADIKSAENFSMDFEQLLTFNPVVYDTTLGICPVPLYEFTVDEAEVFIKNSDTEHIKSILEKHSIYQFFYPPADSLALGFLETENYKPTELISTLSQVPDLGHPFGDNELTDPKNIHEMIDALKEQGLVVEGEFSTIEISEKGVEKRMLVKFKPRESIFKRLSNIFSIKVDVNLKDLFGGGGAYRG